MSRMKPVETVTMSLLLNSLQIQNTQEGTVITTHRYIAILSTEFPRKMASFGQRENVRAERVETHLLSFPVTS